MISISLFTEWAEPSKLQKINPTFDAQNIYQIISYLFFVYFSDLQIFILKFIEPLSIDAFKKILTPIIGKVHIESHKFDKPLVRVFGDVAILTFTDVFTVGEEVIRDISAKRK